MAGRALPDTWRPWHEGSPIHSRYSSLCNAAAVVILSPWHAMLPIYTICSTHIAKMLDPH
jgi:hypothetical protein